MTAVSGCDASAFPYAGIIRIRFDGYNLSPSQEHPLVIGTFYKLQVRNLQKGNLQKFPKKGIFSTVEDKMPFQ